MTLLLLVFITQTASGASMSAADPELSSVPEPTNVEIEAYNFDTVVSWNYPSMSQTPIFTVQVKNYGEEFWIDTCNTSHHNCNIVSMINDPSLSLWARVKATIGQEESAYVESKEFILCKQGKIGPPKLSIRRKEDQIIIDIFHPLVTINGHEPEALYYEENDCHTLKYRVYVKINGSQMADTVDTLKEDDCNETQCHLSIPVSSLNSKYCISAEGYSDTWPVPIEKSEEHCITISDHKSIVDSVWIPIVAAFLLFLGLFLVVVCCSIKKINPFKRKSITLPKSLVSVVKNVSSETKSDLKYISPVTYEPIVPENEKVICEEQLSPATISGSQTEDNQGKAGQKEDLSSETEVVITEENTSGIAPGSPLTPVKREASRHSSSGQSEPSTVLSNSYHSRDGSDSGLVGSEGFLSDSEFPPNNKPEIKTGEQEPIMLRDTATSFGYDKPHVFVELPVGEDGKESLIGYRSTKDPTEHFVR